MYFFARALGPEDPRVAQPTHLRAVSNPSYVFPLVQGVEWGGEFSGVCSLNYLARLKTLATNIRSPHMSPSILQDVD